MAYCGPRGIPLRDGFLRWCQEDQDDALIWAAHEARRCTACGTHPDDWDPDAGGDRHAYKAEMYECEGCVATQRTSEAPEMKDPSRRGMRIRLVRRR